MATLHGLGRKSKLPKAGHIEHRDILPPSYCEDRDQGWVAGSQQSPIETLQVDCTTINQSQRKDLYVICCAYKHFVLHIVTRAVETHFKKT